MPPTPDDPGASVHFLRSADLDGDKARDILPALNIVSAASLATKHVPPREWLVPALIPARQASALVGDGEVGKSLLALGLAFAVATGITWLGLQPARGPAIFVGAEDEADEMHRRLTDISTARGVALSACGDLHLLSLAETDATLAAPSGRDGAIGMTPLWRAIERRVAEIRPALLVLDNSADVFGGNEIVRVQVRQFVAALRSAAMRYNMAILLLSHPSQAGLASGSGTSGSTAWSNSVRSRLYLERPRVEGGSPYDPDARILRLKKSNYARSGAEFRLRWAAGALDLDRGDECQSKAAAAETRAETVFLELLRQYQRQGRHVSHQRSVSYAPAVFAKEQGSGRVGKDALEAAMNRLFAAERIRIGTHGRASKERSHIEEAVA